MRRPVPALVERTQALSRLYGLCSRGLRNGANPSVRDSHPHPTSPPHPTHRSCDLALRRKPHPPQLALMHLRRRSEARRHRLSPASVCRTRSRAMTRARPRRPTRRARPAGRRVRQSERRICARARKSWCSRRGGASAFCRPGASYVADEASDGLLIWCFWYPSAPQEAFGKAGAGEGSVCGRSIKRDLRLKLDNLRLPSEAVLD